MATTRGRDRGAQVRTLFSEIAPRYDLLNRLLSLSVDRWWRRVAVRRLRSAMAEEDGADRSGWVLDVCAGTLDLGIELARRDGFAGRVAAVDFAFPMLRLGQGKLRGERISPACGDGLRLPFPDDTFRGAMVAFGVRNLADVRAGISELARVLRPGAPLVILEFTTPPRAPLRQLYLFYFRRILPLVGRLVSGHRWAYAYLPESVKEFPPPDELAEILASGGFDRVEWEYLTGGITSVHLARRATGPTARSSRPGRG